VAGELSGGLLTNKPAYAMAGNTRVVGTYRISAGALDADSHHSAATLLSYCVAVLRGTDVDNHVTWPKRNGW
jgi:hypothetical protein